MSDIMRPIGGEFVASASARRAACRKLGHPLLYLNLNKSKRYPAQNIKIEVMSCHCGKREESFTKRLETTRDASIKDTNSGGRE